MNKVWYYTVNGDRQGPVSAAELKQLATDGTIGPDDLVWKEGMAEWAPAKNIKGLFAPGAESKPAAKPEARKEEPKEDDGDAFAGMDKGSSKKRPARDEEEDDGDAFAGMDSKKGKSRRDDDEDEEDDRPARKSSKRSSERDDYDDEDDGGSRKQLPHRGGLIMTLGLMSLILTFCGFAPLTLGLAIPAMLMGKKDLKLMRERKMDRSGEGNTKAGFITGIIGLVLGLIALLIYCIYIAFFGILFGAAAGAGAGGR